jgi:tRNA(adenine34) deaminase
MQQWMREALEEANKAAAEGEVPVGAVVVLVLEGRIVGRGHNRMEQRQDATAHAELLAIQEAAASLGRWRMDDCQLYVTLEPCLMCLGAVLNSRIKRLVIGAVDAKSGGVHALRFQEKGRRLHGLEIYEGILEEACGQLLTNFFKDKRI